MTDDLRIKEIKELSPPSHLIRESRSPADAAHTRARRRSWIEQADHQPPAVIHAVQIRCTACARHARSAALSVHGNSRIRWDGGDSSLISLIRRSSVMYLTLWLRPFSMIASIGEKKRQVVGLAVSCRVAACRTCHPTPAARHSETRSTRNEKMDIVRQVLA